VSAPTLIDVACPSPEEKAGDNASHQPADMSLPGDAGNKRPEDEKHEDQKPEGHGDKKVRKNPRSGYHDSQGSGNSIDSPGSTDSYRLRRPQPDVENITQYAAAEIEQ